MLSVLPRSCPRAQLNPSLNKPSIQLYGRKRFLHLMWHLPLLCSSLVVDGQWGLWSQWTPCSKTCGTGVTIRNRYCNNPAPENGGKPCVGDNQESRPCSLKDQCPAGKWQEIRVSHIISFTAAIRVSRNACHVTDCHVLLVTFCLSWNGLWRCVVKHLYGKHLNL